MTMFCITLIYVAFQIIRFAKSSFNFLCNVFFNRYFLVFLLCGCLGFIKDGRPGRNNISPDPEGVGGGGWGGGGGERRKKINKCVSGNGSENFT